nr:reverse transcriptase domain-containing protein [Tanacetum cinerariifolium]
MSRWRRSWEGSDRNSWENANKDSSVPHKGCKPSLLTLRIGRVKHRQRIRGSELCPRGSSPGRYHGRSRQSQNSNDGVSYEWRMKHPQIQASEPDDLEARKTNALGKDSSGMKYLRGEKPSLTLEQSIIPRREGKEVVILKDTHRETIPPEKMSKKDEEKTTFHTDEGVYFYTKMPFGQENARDTYQRLVDTIFKGKIRQNLEAYVDDMVIKSKTDQDLIRDVEETLLALKKVNMKLNPKKCSFTMEEGKFLSYVVTFKEIGANPKKTKAVINIPSPRNLKQMQSFSVKLAVLNRFISTSAERAIQCLDILKKCTNKKRISLDRSCRRSFPEHEKKLVAELLTLTTPFKGKELMVYLCVADEAVYAVLLVERNEKQMPTNYVSRSL